MAPKPVQAFWHPAFFFFREILLRPGRQFVANYSNCTLSLSLKKKIISRRQAEASLGQPEAGFGSQNTHHENRKARSPGPITKAWCLSLASLIHYYCMGVSIQVKIDNRMKSNWLVQNYSNVV